MAMDIFARWLGRIGHCVLITSNELFRGPVQKAGGTSLFSKSRSSGGVGGGTVQIDCQRSRFKLLLMCL